MNIRQLIEAERDVRKDRDVAPAERALAAAMRKGFRAQQRDLMARITRQRALWFTEAVLVEAVPPGEFDALWDAVEDATAGPMANALQSAASIAVQAGGTSATTDLSLNVRFDLKFPGATAYLRNHGAERVRGINDTTRKALRDLLAQSADEGWSFSRTGREIRARFKNFHTPDPRKHIRDRAELIAVTEVGEAYEQGRRLVLDSLAAQGVQTEKNWITAGDDRTCPICEPNGLAGWIAGNATFPSGHNQPLAHPACFPAGVLVVGPAPLASTTRWFEGELVEIITASGGLLPVTPNHPILTDQGWVAAGSLHNGSHVIRRTVDEWVPSSVNPHDYQEPTRIERVTAGLSNVAVRIPGAAHDFHGDGNTGQQTVIRDSGRKRPDRANDVDLARDLLGGLAGPVETDEIVALGRTPFSGHVYNLETTQGWYSANGIIVHNCRCDLLIRIASPVTANA